MCYKVLKIGALLRVTVRKVCMRPVDPGDMLRWLR